MLKLLGVGASALSQLLQVSGLGLAGVVGVGDVRADADEEGGVFVVGIGADLVRWHVQRVLYDVVEGSGATVAVIEHVRNPRRANDEARRQRRLFVAAVRPDKLIALRSPTFRRRLVHVILVLRTDRLVVVQD